MSARDALLLSYLDGTCTPDEQAQVERDPALLQRLEELRALDQMMEQAWSMSPTTPTEDLVDFAAGTLDAPHALTMGRAAQDDPSIQEEVDALRDLLAHDPFAPQALAATPLAALFQAVREVIQLAPAPQPVGVRGDVLYFEGPSVALTLRQRRVEGEDPCWNIRGVVEQHGIAQRAVVILQAASGEHYRTLANDEGIFRFSGLHDGTYDLTLLLADQQQEVRLHQLVLT
jgi:hypothetical protein